MKLIQQLANFTLESSFEHLPAEVVEESKRIVLDSIGCALAAVAEPKGRMGLEFGRLLGGSKEEATILGTGERTSLFGAAFANGELINALDYDIVLPPGHVTPYVLPVVLAVGESVGASGKEVITATAVAHEMSYRFGKAMDNLRDTKDGKVDPPAVFGYASTIFGAAAAAAKLKRLAPEVLANALGIAGSITPVNSQIAWFQHAPSSTIKYLLAGALTQSALTAACMAELGHRGDVQILDDREFGYPRFIGTKKWEPGQLTDGLGVEWRFTPHLSYKPYPHCRILHALLGCLTKVLEKNDIGPEEIEGIKVWVEGMVEQPVWLNRDIQHVHDAQFSIAHGIALGAHRVPPGKAWQDPSLVFSPSVMNLMNKVTHEVHPDYVALLTGHGASRPARVEIKARGNMFVGEQRYPKGVRSPDPESYMTNEELFTKFRNNAQGSLSTAGTEALIAAVMSLERADNLSAVLRQLKLARLPT
jgi:2-methylcitrate dehydratase PrpD